MKVELLTNNEIPGNLLIKAENPSEAMILRIWANAVWTEKRSLMIKSHGGNIEDNRISIVIGFRTREPIQNETHVNDSLSSLAEQAGPLLNTSKELLAATEELQDATTQLNAIASDPERGKRDAKVAVQFYETLLYNGVPDDLAGKMAVAYVRGGGG